MASIRKPRGYVVNRPPYVELSEGARPNVQALVLEGWTGLPIVRLDDQHNDPIVIDAGTIVGTVTGDHGTTSIAGKLMPAAWSSGISGNYSSSAWTLRFASTDVTWGFPPDDTTDLDVGNVKPIGVVFQPIYSFNLEQFFTNYKRTESIGFVTDYVIQIPAVTDDEHAIRAGDVVCVAPNQFDYGLAASVTLNDLAGRFTRRSAVITDLDLEPEYSQSVHMGELDEMVVGRCLKSFEYATDASASTGTKYQDATDLTTSADALAEFAGLNRVQTVPGMSLSGSGTGGVPGHLLGGYSLAGSYRALTILIRL